MKLLFALVALVAACSQAAPSATASHATTSTPASVADSPAVIAPCAAPTCAAGDLQIAHLRVGLVCPQGRPDGGSICFEATRVPITGQGTCVYNGDRQPCTWYGFEFEYANAHPGEEISCIVSSNHNAEFGTPTGVQLENADRYEYRLRLDARAGRYFNPQYSISEPQAPPSARVVDQTVCSLGARELFRFQMELQFPD
jgi:hypothetical protein